MRIAGSSCRIIKEVLVFFIALLFFLALCASIGVLRSSRRAVPVVSAIEMFGYPGNAVFEMVTRSGRVLAPFRS